MKRALGVMSLGLALLAPATAFADDTACIAASEQELPLRQQGKLHEALKQLAICADASCPDEVKAECSRRVAEVDAAMPTLILAAKDGAGNDLVDVQVSMDGVPLLSRLDGLSVAIDPGSHVFRFELAGQPPVERTLLLGEGEKDRRESVVLGPPPPAPPVVVVPAPAVAPPPPSVWTTQKAFAVVAAGVGVASLAVGAVFGGYAISSQNREKTDCGAAGCPNRLQADEDYSKAKENATASTVTIGAGAALVALGAVLWFTARPRHDAASIVPRIGVIPTLAPGTGGIVLTGAL